MVKIMSFRKNYLFGNIAITKVLEILNLYKSANFLFSGKENFRNYESQKNIIFDFTKLEIDLKNFNLRFFPDLIYKKNNVSHFLEIKHSVIIEKNSYFNSSYLSNFSPTYFIFFISDELRDRGNYEIQIENGLWITNTKKMKFSNIQYSAEKTINTFVDFKKTKFVKFFNFIKFLETS